VRTDFDAVIVGSGPNGLAAAVTLARAGCRVAVIEGKDEIGGGTRTRELTLPGLLHDVCSATHPFAAASPFLRSLPLGDFGLQWRYAPIDMVHPLDDGTAGVLHRSLDNTAQGLGADGPRWRAAFGPLTRRFDHLVEDALGPLLRWPSHPIAMARLGIRSALPATAAARLFLTEQARGLFLGCAAHLYQPLNGIGTAALGFMFLAAAHSYGWPVAEGGSAAITGALAAMLESLNGEVVTGVEVMSLRDLPTASVTLFDTTPTAFAPITDGRQRSRRASAYRRYRHRPAAFKADFAVRGGIPWTAEEDRRAGTVYVGSTAADSAAAESQIAQGVMPDLPFILVGQQYLADPQRSRDDVNPVWTYAHVPHRFSGEAAEGIRSQIERFAPGFAERIAATHVMSPAELEDCNPNYIGGDILTGANSLRQLFVRPAFGNPYRTGVEGMYLCSAATPPGAGAHGMYGYHAARQALSYLQRDHQIMPSPVGGS
jgi:phytoene dehydrogenase-like protein